MEELNDLKQQVQLSRCYAGGVARNPGSQQISNMESLTANG